MARTALLSVATVTLALSGPTIAQALEYPGTCRGPAAVVTAITDVDTHFATVSAKLSRVDAERHCRSEYAVGKSVQQCVSGLLRITYKATANCFAGTLETVSSDLPRPDKPKSA